LNRLEGKVAIVTGGAGRIGAACARRFAAEGARVAVADVKEDAARRVADEIGDGAIAVQFDAGDAESIAAMIARAADHFGRIDILHNNAALVDLDFLNRDFDVVGTEIDVWDKTMEVNVRGYMVAAKHAIPHMRRTGGGSIINTSSNAAVAGDSCRIAYGTSKGAILTMTRYIATQHGRDNIRCNAIMPGMILDPELEAKMSELAAMNKRHLLLNKRNGLPEDIAGLAAFLASDDSAFITAQQISCDGGLLAHLPFFADEMDAR